jgi:DNA-binding transcriptional MerR regulator
MLQSEIMTLLAMRRAPARQPMTGPEKDDRPTGVVWLDDAGGRRADPPAERVLSIQNVARMFGVSQLAVRYYEMRGLIKRRHSLDGVRVYGWADCERLAFIIKCRKAGLALSDIIMIIQATEDNVSPLQFKHGQDICLVMIDRLEAQARLIGEALAELNHVHALLTTKLLGENRRE